MNIKKSLIILTAIPLLCILVPIGIYYWNFSAASLSNEPAHWGVFGDYIGGVLNPLLALINLWVVIYIAMLIHRLEGIREKENRALLSKPFCQISGSDFVNSIRVFVKNIGLGPMIVNESKVMKVIDIGNPDAKAFKDLVDLMPPLPPGIYWRNFTINGLPPVIYQNTEVELLRLDGDHEDKQFQKFRDSVRSVLADCYIEIHYSDVFDDRKEACGGILGDIFGR